MDIYYKQKFKKKFPPNIIAKLDESIKLPQLETQKEIPKIIYRTHEKHKIKNYIKAIEMTKKFNPDFEQIIYDQYMIQDFIKNNYSPRILQAYNNISNKYGPAKADFFRILILYSKGGIYLDMKSTGNNLDQLLHHNKLIYCAGRNPSLVNFFHFNPISLIHNSYDWSCFSNSPYGEYNNWCITSPRGNYVLGKMIQQIVSNIEYGLKNREYYNNGEYSVLVLTGPICYTRVIDKYKTTDNSYFLKTKQKDKYFSYSCLSHKKLEGKDHYSKNNDKSILK